jgi:HupE / UreJ protein
MKRTAFVALLWLACTCASAHISSNGFLTLNATRSQFTGTLELAIRDAELAVGVDTNRDAAVTWGEIRTHQSDLEAYVRERLTVSGCAMQFGALQINARVDGSYLWLPFAGTCSAALHDLRIDYRMLQDVDPSHRGLLAITAYGDTQTAVLTPGRGSQTFELTQPHLLRAFAEYLNVGVWHIWSGIDHLLFLFSLLLPAVLRRRDGQWEAIPIARPAFLNILKVVTAFTLAHSITLSLAAFDVVHLPSRLTESVIAASIVVAALNNIFPRVTEGRWRIAFAFGLLHGFGFASVLTEMGLPSGARLVSLLAFNLGVEAGQLAVVLAVMPLAFYFRTTSFYRHTLMRWGSTGIAALALVWLVQRATL